MIIIIYLQFYWNISRSINHQIAKPLCFLINKSLEFGIVPYDLKLAKVIPIFKSKDKSQFSNYRPISLLPSISKIYEKVVFKRLYHFIEGCLYKSQYGFRPKHSTTEAVTELYTDIINAIENKDIYVTVGRFIVSIIRWFVIQIIPNLLFWGE